MNSKGRILIFARTPKMGAVKTRLQPALGEQGCYELHEMLVNHTIDTAIGSEIAPVEVWHTGNPDHSFWQDKRGKLRIELNEQKGADLGARMFNAVASHLSVAQASQAQGSSAEESNSSSSDWVVLIGSDCPEIDEPYLQQAASLLESGEDIVLGPAEDGGYVLIGLRKAHAFLFHDIPWGTDSVFAATIARAEEHNCGVCCMQPLRDLDVAADLSYYQGKLPWTNSVSRPEFISKS